MYTVNVRRRCGGTDGESLEKEHKPSISKKTFGERELSFDFFFYRNEKGIPPAEHFVPLKQVEERELNYSSSLLQERYLCLCFFIHQELCLNRTVEE